MLLDTVVYAAAVPTLTIACGRIGRMYHHVMERLCDIVNNKRDDIRCVAAPSNSLTTTVPLLENGKVDMVIIQSLFLDEYNGKDLYFVMNVLPEEFGAFVREDSKYHSFTDLNGAKIEGALKSDNLYRLLSAVSPMFNNMPDGVTVVNNGYSPQNRLCLKDVDAMLAFLSWKQFGQYINARKGGECPIRVIGFDKSIEPVIQAQCRECYLKKMSSGDSEIYSIAANSILVTTSRTNPELVKIFVDALYEYFFVEHGPEVAMTILDISRDRIFTQNHGLLSYHPALLPLQKKVIKVKQEVKK